jgi:hypothetical protein
LAQAARLARRSITVAVEVWGRVIRRCLGGLAATAALLVVPACAQAQNLGTFGLGGLPTQILPPNPGNSAQMISPGFDDCPSGDQSCPAKVILEMYERWRPLNASCDHRAVFALTYLRTTEAFASAADGEPGFFQDRPWVTHEDAVFADLYYRAFDQALNGQAVPGSWAAAFAADDSPDVTGIGDMFLGMNAHINRDLSYTLAAVGLVMPGGASRKTDHDRVNTFLARVADPLQDELGRRYDPLFGTTDTPTPLDEQTVLDAIQGMRENAWRNAESLVNAGSDSARANAEAGIEAQSVAFANSIRAANTIPGYGPTRDAYCRAHLMPSFTVAVPDTRARRAAKRRRLAVSVYRDGPARFSLTARARGGHLGRRSFASKRRRFTVKLARTRNFYVGAAGTSSFTLPLTRRGRALLRKRGATVEVALTAPRGMRASSTASLRGKRRRR